MATRDELQALLQLRLDVLQVELSEAMQAPTETPEQKLNAMIMADAFAGARMELRLLARFLGLPVESPVEMARSETDAALYPSSEAYEIHMRHMQGICGCGHNHRKQVS